MPERSSFSFLRIFDDSDAIALPITASGNDSLNKHIFTVDIFINGVEVKAFLDLGYAGSILTTVDYKDLKLNLGRSSRMVGVQILGRIGRGRVTEAKEVRIGHLKKKNVQTVFFNSDLGPDLTIIGVRFLKHFTTTFDFPNRMLYLTPTS